MPLLIAYLLGLLTGIKGTDTVNHTSNPHDKSRTGCPTSATNSQIQLAIKANEKPKKRKKNGFKIYMAIVHTLTMAAVIWYAILTNSLLNTNNFTVQEIKKQTTMIRQQLVGTQAATVVLNGPVGAGPLVTLGSKVNISIGLKNDGHVIAKDVTVNLVAKLIDLASNKPAGNRQWPCSYAIDTLPPPTPTLPAVYRQCFVTGLTKQDLAMIDALTRTIEIEGSFTYDNGFEEKRTENFCLRYSAQVKTLRGLEGSHNFETCETFEVGREIILHHMKTAND
jgi:hypothetical protein